MYHNQPKFSNGQVWANSVDPDQIAPEEQSDQGLHCLPFVCIFWVHYSVIKPNCSTFKTAIFWVSQLLGFLRYIKFYKVQ